MRRNGICAVLLVAALQAAAAAPGDAREVDAELLGRLRQGFEQAAESAALTRELQALLVARLPPGRADWPPVFQAYEAALEGLTGKHARLPWDKFNHTKSGLARLDTLVAAHPDSIEIRALRYFFCAQLPEFFAVQPTVQADFAALLDLYAREADETVAGDYREQLRQRLLRNSQTDAEALHPLQDARPIPENENEARP